MNKFILCCFVLVALLSVHQQWTGASVLKDEAVDDYLEVKRSLLEEEDDEEFDCHAEEHSNRKRSARGAAVKFQPWIHTITYRFNPSIPCENATKEGIKVGMNEMMNHTNLKFASEESAPGANVDLLIQCENRKNYAPIGIPYREQNYVFSVHNYNNPVTLQSAVQHELAHVAGLYHGQQEPCTKAVLKFHEDCLVDPMFEKQFTPKLTKYEALCNFPSLMTYNKKAFQKEKTCYTQTTVMNCATDDAIGSQKTLTFVEFSKIQLLMCKYETLPRWIVPEQLQPGQYFGKDCKAKDYPLYGGGQKCLQETEELDESAKRNLTVTYGQLLQVTCTGNGFVVNGETWTNVKGTTSTAGEGKCMKRGNPRITAISNGVVQTILFGCMEHCTGTDRISVANPQNATLFIDGCRLTSGQLSVSVECKSEAEDHCGDGK